MDDIRMKRNLIFFTTLLSMTANASYITDLSIKTIKKSDKVKSMREEVKQSKLDYYKEIGEYLPSVDLSLDHGYEYMRKFNENADEPELRLTRQSSKIKLTQLVFDGGATIYNISKTKLKYQIQNDELKIKIQDELKKFYTDYTKAYFAYKKLNVLKRLYQASSDYYDQELKLKKSGISVQEDLANSLKFKYRNKVRVQKMANELADLRRKLYTYTDNRNIKLYLPKPTNFQELYRPNLKTLKKSNLQMEVKRKRINYEKNELSYRKAQLISPKLEAVASHNLEKNASRTPGFQRTNYIGLSLSYKIDGFNKFHSLKQARSGLRKSKHDLLNVSEQQHQRLMITHNDYQLANDELNLNKQIEKEFKKLISATERSFKTGQASPKDLYTTKSAHIESLLDNLSSHENKIVHYIDLLSVYGKLNFNSVK